MLAAAYAVELDVPNGARVKLVHWAYFTSLKPIETSSGQKATTSYF